MAEDAVKAEHAIVEAGRAEDAGADAASCITHSFVATTAVRLADGSSKPISKVKPGDVVLATDPQTGVTAPEQVKNVIVTTTDKDFTTLTLDTAPVRGPPSATGQHKAASATLTTTWHHPFWDTARHRWTDAHDLTAGTKLRRADGTTVTVTGIHNYHRGGTTYDLTVGTVHTYYVLAGATPVLVHNCPDDAVTLYRFGSGPETTEKLAQDAANAEAHDFPHGISTSKRLPPKIKESGEYRSTSVGDLRERGFQVEHTGKNQAHHTVHLPKPVTDEVTQSLN
ncbi:HINT domain-containing protein [Streptomyces sp. IBSBF 2953]|nr:HINT domain-containing protein [Streptomyces hayashii]